MINVRVGKLGGRARKALDHTAGGRILAVFEHSFYLQTAEGELVCIGPDTLCCGPLHAVCTLAKNRWRTQINLTPGQRIRIASEHRIITGRLQICYARAVLWQPPPPQLPPHPAALRDSLSALQTAVWAYQSQRPLPGLGPLIGPLIDHSAELNPAAVTDPALRYSVDRIAELRRSMAICYHQPLWFDERCDSVITRLLGAGPGLTPSGDDFLGGALLALRTLGQPALADRLAQSVLSRAPVRTNLISLGHLRCAASGLAAEPVHAVLAALSSGATDYEPHLKQMAAIGHSSGWDTLAGIAGVCALHCLSR